MKKLELLPRDTFRVLDYLIEGEVLTVTLSFGEKESEVSMYARDFVSYLENYNKLFYREEVLVCGEKYESDKKITVTQYFEDARDWNENFLLSDLRDFVVYAAAK